MAEKTPKPPTFPKFVMVWRSFCPQATQHMQRYSHDTCFIHSCTCHGIAKALEDCRHRRRSQCGIRSSQGQVLHIDSHVTPMNQWTEDDGIGVGCNTCKDGCLLAMSFMSNLYCCAFTGYTHTQLSDTNCSLYVRCSFLAVCIETPWIFITSINQFAPVSSFRYRLIPRWFSFIHVGWPTMGQVYFDDRPITPGYQKSTEEAAFERRLGFHSTYGKQVGLGSKDASRWCIEYTYIIVCIHIIIIYYIYTYACMNMNKYILYTSKHHIIVILALSSVP